jgi:uncharacterized protein YoxC
MPWYALLIVALASVAFVLAVLASVGLKAWRLAKHGAAVSRRVTPLVDGLSRRGDELTRAVEHLSADSERLNASLVRLQRSLARLQVIVSTFNAALRPYYVLAGWLSGEREWGDLGI